MSQSEGTLHSIYCFLYLAAEAPVTKVAFRGHVA